MTQIMQLNANEELSIHNIRIIIKEINEYNKNNSTTSKFNDFETIILNVSGFKYEVLKTKLNRFPNTKLGQLVNVDIAKQSEICQIKGNEYYFDRDPFIMNLILNFYSNGKLHLSEIICVNSFKQELLFWELDEDQIDICCKLKFFNQISEVEEQIEFERNAIKRFKDLEYFGPRFYPDLRRKIWNLFDKPESSIYAQVILRKYFFIKVCFS